MKNKFIVPLLIIVVGIGCSEEKINVSGKYLIKYTATLMEEGCVPEGVRLLGIEDEKNESSMAEFSCNIAEGYMQLKSGDILEIRLNVGWPGTFNVSVIQSDYVTTFKNVKLLNTQQQVVYTVK